MQLCPLLFMFPSSPILHYCRGYLGLLMCLIAAIVPSVCLGSHPLLQGLHYHRSYKGLLMCLKAAMVSSLNLGSSPCLTSFALLQRVLGTVNVL